LLIPNNEGFIAVVTGALNSLVLPENWYPDGTLTPEQSAAALVDMFDGFCFAQGVCRVIGEIIQWAGTASPDPKWLVCDGGSLLRADYPDLFAVIGVTYGSADGTHFNIPDLRGRTALGVGSGTGLSTYNAGDAGGEENHTLTTPETPSHSHADAGHTHTEGIAVPAIGAALVGVPIPSAVPGIGVTGLGSANIGNAGGGGSHNNLQPYLATNFLIVALT
jgi:microcystin-dependent protein